MIAVGEIDELHLHVAPVLLGTGISLFERAIPAPIGMEVVEVVASPAVTHTRYRMVR